MADTGQSEARILNSAQMNLEQTRKVLDQVDHILGEQKPTAAEGGKEVSTIAPLEEIQALLDASRKTLLEISEKLAAINSRIW